ncbi:MAG: DUF2877 domain-containing protein, partial [Chloroflexota bacterium]
MDAVSIGCWAAEKLLAAPQAARVWGVTSRGVFLHLQSNWIVFLSYEAYRGPLTINLPADDRRFNRLAPGAAVFLHPGGLEFPELQDGIDWTHAPVWQAAQLPDAAPDLAAARRRLAALQDDAPGPVDLFACLGQGPGLTPAGDDFTAGALLAFSRWGPALQLAGGRLAPSQAWRSRLVAQAYQRTTTLSANLIECAAGGQADERPPATVDVLPTSGPPDN